MNVSQVSQGSEGVPASQYHQLLDGNLSSCIGLPVQGEVPPIFWMKMNTSSMNISSRSYNVTVVGDKISCNRHGSKLLQVSSRIGMHLYLKLNTRKKAPSHRYLVYKPFEVVTPDCPPETRGRRVFLS